ncbi:hypothetical protein LIER_10599 [Lithospermum erythrorhizon]|uniref:Uncharacterized protein n=1 Tax=Lithospermum erythrorhizon TaxID=34254 RepID=A0AAV3PLM3_LITER
MPEMISLHRLLGLDWGVKVGLIQTLNSNATDSFPTTNPLNSDTCPKSKLLPRPNKDVHSLANLSKRMAEEALDDECKNKKPSQKVQEEEVEPFQSKRKKLKTELNKNK